MLARASGYRAYLYLKVRFIMEDSVREFLEKLRKKAVVMTSAAESTLKEAGRKTSETFEVAKLNMKIFDLNSDI